MKRAGDSSAQGYLLFVVALLLVATLGTLAQLAFATAGLAATELFLILLPAVVFVRAKRLPVVEALRLRAVPASVALSSLAVGITMWGAAAGIHQLLVPLLGAPPPSGAPDVDSVWSLLAALVAGALLAGVCEEALFRGAIQGVLERHGDSRAVVITAALFALFHMSPWALIPAFFLGLVFGALVVRTGSVLPAMLAHLGNNATAFTVGHVLRDRPEEVAYWLMGGLAVLFAVAVVVAHRLTAGLDPEASPLESAPGGLDRVLVWVAAIAAGAVALVGVLVVGVLLRSVGVETVTGDELAPELRSGDRIVLLRAGIVPLDLKPGDLVSVGPGDQTSLARVVRAGESEVLIEEPGRGEREVPRSEIGAKVVHTLRGAEPP